MVNQERETIELTWCWLIKFHGVIYKRYLKFRASVTRSSKLWNPKISIVYQKLCLRSLSIHNRTSTTINWKEFEQKKITRATAGVTAYFRRWIFFFFFAKYSRRFVHSTYIFNWRVQKAVYYNTYIHIAIIVFLYFLFTYLLFRCFAIFRMFMLNVLVYFYAGFGDGWRHTFVS